MLETQPHWEEHVLGVVKQLGACSQVVVFQGGLVIVGRSKIVVRPDEEVIVHAAMPYST